MYTEKNYKTKKELKEAFKQGQTIYVYQPGPFPGEHTGTVCIEGPKYPEMHKWYATVEIKDNIIIKIK